jgi:hypothetical protein
MLTERRGKAASLNPAWEQNRMLYAVDRLSRVRCRRNALSLHRTFRRAITFSSKVVWTTDDTVDLYLATHWGQNYRGGSTVVHASRMTFSSTSHSAPSMSIFTMT